ncbi:Asp-tRNA(Asn)/Glu-tRNA(Gln) amidotransferase subunit GatA [Candidatus Wolfebacteria bacterium]|nr:Asp-tRNA(Asn)/Glu-tRNA(Gln) amidotransferase subunit GatA [Candidatus Wolfebacteria bacterium]
MTITTARKHLDEGDFSAVELAEAHLSAIREKDSDIQAYLEVFDDILNQARKADEKLRTKDSKQRTSFLGIPLAVKDNILIEGHITSAASTMLKNYTAAYDATVTKKLKDVGAIFLGRTNMDDAAMGTSTESSPFQVTKNPHDTTRVPGGSSGGSAAAVAADMALAALGSDTAGSIRQPSALCGVIGLKPTYGAVSRYGLIALGSSLDCIGPITRTIADAELVFNVIKGKDPMDSTTVDRDDYPLIKKQARSIGVPWKFLEHETIDKRVLTIFKEALSKLKTLGYEIRDINLPHADYAVPAYYVYLPAEASTNLARYDGVKYGLHVDGEDLLGDYLATRQKGFGPEPRRRIILGTYVLSAGYHDAYYNRAMGIRRLIKKDFDAAFAAVDLVATPTSLGPAFKIGQKIGDPVQLYLEDLFTVLANHTGMPAISIPAGNLEEEEKQLPLGIQFIAPHLHEELLFSVGKRFLGEE